MSEALSSHVPWWQSVVVHLFHRHWYVSVSSVTPSTGTLHSGWAGLRQLALVTALTRWEAQTHAVSTRTWPWVHRDPWCCLSGAGGELTPSTHTHTVYSVGGSHVERGSDEIFGISNLFGACELVIVTFVLVLCPGPLGIFLGCLLPCRGQSPVFCCRPCCLSGADSYQSRVDRLSVWRRVAIWGRLHCLSVWSRPHYVG